MTNTESINFVLTLVSILVTVISIICSVFSFKAARKAKQYKGEIIKYKELLDLRTLLDKFISESQNFQNRTRKTDWYKGQDSSLVITPFNNVLLSFGEYYHLMTNGVEMQFKVHSLQEAIQNYSAFTMNTRKTINRLITDIIELLQKDTRSMTHEMLVKS